MGAHDDEAKAKARQQAIWIFVFCGLYFFVINGGLSSLIALEAVWFFLAGVVLAPLFVGTPVYWVQRGIGKLLFRRSDDTELDEFDEGVDPVHVGDILVTLVQLVVIFLATRLAYQAFIEW